MKFFYLNAMLALSAFLGIKADLKEDYRIVRDYCVEESDSPPEEIMKYISDGMNPDDLTDNVKCVHKCLLERPGYMRAGKLDDAVVIKSLEIYPELKDHAEDLATAVEHCKDEEGSDDCDTAYNIITCFKDYESGQIVLNDEE